MKNKITKIDEMVEYCEKNQIFWFCDLVNHASKKRGDWFRTLVTERGTKVMAGYLASKAHKAGLLTDEVYEKEFRDEY